MALLKRLMGHSTVGYDRRPEAATRKAAELVGVPPVRVEAASLTEALYDAVIQSEATGWTN